MLEQETEQIIAKLTERTIGARESISLEEVLHSDVPRSVKAYIRAEVLQSIERDVARAPSLGRIDRSAPGTEQLARHFFRTLAGQYRFPRDEFLVMLDHAVHFAENYLCRPQWTLRNFLFGDSPTADAGKILARLDSIAEYEYFPTLIQRVLRDSASPVGSDAFGELVSVIDDQVVRQHSAGELAALMRPVFDFFLLSRAGVNGAITVKPLLVFLEDKKLKVLREYVERICRIRNTDAITLDELASMIDELYTGRTSIPTDGEQPPDTTSSEAPEADAASEPEEAADLFPSSDEDELPAARPEPETTRSNIPLSLTFSGMLDHSPTEPPTAHGLPDLKVTISPELQDHYVRKVFMNDYDYYATVIAALNSFETWDEANAYLERLYELNGLNPVREEVAEFTSTVRKRYPGNPAK